MLIKRNTEPRNKEFFDRVAPVIPYVAAAGIIFQVISAITEAFGIHQFSAALRTPWMVNLFFTVAIVVGWELLIRVSVQYIFKTVTLWARKEIRLEKLELFLIVLALLIGIPAIYYSFAVSKENAHMTFEVMMPERDTLPVASIEANKAATLDNIQSDYAQRRADIENRYKEQDRAASGVYSAAKATHNANIEEWQRKEKKYHKNYPTQIKREKDAINAAYSFYKIQAKEIAEAKAEALAQLDQWRDGQEGETITQAGDHIDEENQKRATFAAWFKKFSVIWSHFAGLSVVFAVLCVVFVIVFRVLAGIEEETHLTPESLDPGLWNEFMYLMHLKIKSPIRNRIRTAINKTAAKRVDLEIVTPSTISVTHERYAPPTVTGRAETVTHPLRSAPVTPVTHTPKPVTESVTEIRYGAKAERAKHELPTHVTPVTPVTVTESKGGAVPKPESVTPSEAVVVELEPTVTAKKPEPHKKLVTDLTPTIYMVTATKAVIIDLNGEKETVTLQQVQSRKRGNFGNIEKRKTKAAKDRCRLLWKFYESLEAQMKDAK